jgi:anti-anti-sigma factor
VTHPAAHDAGLSLSCRAEHDGYVIAALAGDLDIASAPALREQLLSLLRPAASRLIIDLSAVGYADASGLAVLVSSGRRAGLLGGSLRLVAPSPEVARVLSLTGINRHLDIFPTVQAAITGQRPLTGPADARTGIAASVEQAQPAQAHLCRARRAADDGELRMAIAALLVHADAWRDADPRRQFAPALQALARADAGTSHAALIQSAHSLLSVLTHQPLTHSPAVAATASRLRRLLDPDHRPAMS